MPSALETELIARAYVDASMERVEKQAAAEQEMSKEHEELARAYVDASFSRVAAMAARNSNDGGVTS